VLDHDEAVGAEDLGSSKRLEKSDGLRLVLAQQGIGWIEENQVERTRGRELWNGVERVVADNRRPTVDAEAMDVLIQGFEGGAGGFHERAGCGSATEGLQSQGSAAGEEIGHGRIGDEVAKDAEERGPDSSARGARVLAPRCLEVGPSCVSCDDVKHAGMVAGSSQDVKRR